MKILIDITHPAHVHFFKHAIWAWEKSGQRVIITSRDKDLTRYLLDQYRFDHQLLSKARKGMMGLALEMLERGSKLWPLVRREQPAIMIGIGGTFIAPIGKLTGIPVIAFTDTEHAKVSNAITFPLVNAVSTPACYENEVKQKHITYPGYHELAYLHPNHFTPDPTKLQSFGVSPDTPYILIRLVAWSSGHDFGDSGFSDLKTAVQKLSQYGKVLISSEVSLPPKLATHEITVSPEEIHHLLAFAKLYIGESATMASEGAVLGVPSIFISTSTRGYTNEQEYKYDLVYTFSDPHTAQKQGLEKALFLLQNPNLQTDWQIKREKMLNKTIDVTLFIMDIVEKYAHP